MKVEYVRDPYNRLIGMVEYWDNGDWMIKEFPSQKILGFYRKSIDMTTDFYGRWLSKGNTAMSLLYTQNQQK